MSVTINGTNGLVFNDASTQSTSPFAGGLGFRNRIINGAFMIDQRNAGASVTVNSDSDFYSVDRFAYRGEISDGVFTAQQTTTAPAGFKNSVKITVTTADTSLGSTQSYLMRQRIEGFNCADLAWGTASASAVTLSFWVRSSLTGTFGGAIINSAFNRSYPFSYTISAADTWEYKTVTIPGDTTGTWLTDNGTGMVLSFSFGAGSGRTGTAGAWVGANTQGVTGQVSLIGTNGATFYITGVQLEKGSTATSFDYRPYGTELALCQRYYQQINGANSNSGNIWSPFMIAYATDAAQGSLPLPVVMRSAPSLSFSGQIAIEDGSTPKPSSSSSFNGSNVSPTAICYWINGFTGLTQWRGYYAFGYTASSALKISAEL